MLWLAYQPHQANGQEPHSPLQQPDRKRHSTSSPATDSHRTHRYPSPNMTVRPEIQAEPPQIQDQSISGRPTNHRHSHLLAADRTGMEHKRADHRQPRRLARRDRTNDTIRGLPNTITRRGATRLLLGVRL